MPSHKHKKKRKRSHKQTKKIISSSSEDEKIAWKIRCSSSGSDASDNGEILSSFVRKSYTKHLQQALTQNFEGWIDISNQKCTDGMQELISQWSSVIEQRALRTSLQSELYRKSMVCVIKQIKESTSKGKCYVTEKDLFKLKQKLPLSKETQTETISKRLCVSGTQTDPSFSSLLDLPLPKTLALSPASRPYDPAIDFSDSQSVSSSQPLELRNINPDNCKITSTSDILQSAHCSTIDLKQIDENNSFSLKDNPNLLIANNISINQQQNCTAEEIIPVANANVKSAKSVRSIYKKEEIKPKNERIHSEKGKLKPINNEKDDLNARLTEMGLLSDTENDLDYAEPKLSSTSKKSNWFAEEIAQSCNFTRILLKMSTKQRERVMVRINELFGDKNEPLAELSEKNINICRKRIASVVVMELTPLYQAKKIASRYLFKFLAKQITKSIMEQSYAPDSRSIRWKVRDFFADGKIIMSETDCY